MNFSITRDEDIEVTRIEFKGRLDRESFLDSVRSARAMPSHSYRTLLVVTPETIVDLSSRDVDALTRALRAERKEDAPRGRHAIVAPTNLAFGVARMGQGFWEAGPSEIRVFPSEDEALAWLTS